MATWLSGISRQHRIIRKNAFLWFGIFFFAFTIVILRLAWLQVVEGRFYRQLSDRYHTRVVTLRAARGQILDRNLNPLVIDDQRTSLFVDPTLVVYPDVIARQLAPVVNLPEAEILAKLTQQDASVTIKPDVTPEIADNVRRQQLPGIVVNEQGVRYRIGIDLEKMPRSAGLANQLAEALKVPVPQIERDLGDLISTLTDAEGNPTHPSGQRWVSGTYAEAEKSAATALHIGVIAEPAGPNYTVMANPGDYVNDRGSISAVDAARRLSPILGVPQRDIERQLLFRTRFVVLKTDLSEDQIKAVQRLQGTMYVVEPGKLLQGKGTSEETIKNFREAVIRVHDMLDGGDTPLTLTAEQIEERLSPGAQPGPLAMKLVKEMPDIRIHQRLYAKPIDGVIYGLPGVGVLQEPRRHYVYNTLAAATLGWVGDVRVNPHGAFGLEFTEEKQLMGLDGQEKKEIDSRRRTIPERSERREPANGKNIVLTLDLTIQQIVEEELAKAVQDAKAMQGESLVMDPKTGEILAIANYPTWDANAPGKSARPLVNPTISNFYEPGSTFKVLSVIAALEEGLMRDGQLVTNCTGALTIGRRTIKDSHGAHHAVDCGTLLEVSCNIGAATLALKLGPDRFMNWCEKLGFGARTGIELANESPGSLNKKNVNAKITLANMGFGQSLAVTPVQMAAMYGAVANGGEWIQPHLVKSRQNADGTWTPFTASRRRVFSENTAALVRGYLQRVIDGKRGTGKLAAIDGYSVGGKTGTAQKATAEGGYRSGLYIGSFIGIMPVEDPRLVIITVIDEPHNGYYGGTIAGPSISAIGRRSLQYLGVPPTQTTPSSPKK